MGLTPFSSSRKSSVGSTKLESNKLEFTKVGAEEAGSHLAEEERSELTTTCIHHIQWPGSGVAMRYVKTSNLFNTVIIPRWLGEKVLIHKELPVGTTSFINHNHWGITSISGYYNQTKYMSYITNSETPIFELTVHVLVGVYAGSIYFDQSAFRYSVSLVFHFGSLSGGEGPLNPEYSIIANDI